MSMTTSLQDNLIVSLEELLDRLTDDRAKLDERIGQVQKDLAALKRGHPIDSDSVRKTRRERGANRKAVRKLFEENESLALSIPGIAEKAGIPTSSARAATYQLKDKGVLERSGDGLWRKKKQFERSHEGDGIV